MPVDRPWEGNYNSCNTSTTTKTNATSKCGITPAATSPASSTDPASKSYNRVKPVQVEGSNRPCLAYSTDGIHWEKPDLGLVQFESSRHNNLLPPQNEVKYIFHDPREEDATRRFKGLVRYADSDPQRVHQLAEESEIYYTKAPHWISDLEQRGAHAATIQPTT